MLSISAKIRKDFKGKVKNLRKKGILPGVLYGPKIKNTSIELGSKEFKKVYKEAGESSLISLTIDKEKFLVLIHALEIDPLTQESIHVDFYQPKLDEEIITAVPLAFEGEAQAVKDLGGTLIKNIHEIEVKAFPQNLPHEIKVNIEKLKTFEDSILIKDLILPKDVKVLKDPEIMVASIAQPVKIEEELEKPVEEKVEEVEKVEEGKKKEAEEEETGNKEEERSKS